MNLKEKNLALIENGNLNQIWGLKIWSSFLISLICFRRWKKSRKNGKQSSLKPIKVNSWKDFRTWKDEALFKSKIKKNFIIVFNYEFNFNLSV
jgi:hypothetical protein